VAGVLPAPTPPAASGKPGRHRGPAQRRGRLGVLTDAENGDLNPLGVNCLRAFPTIGRVVWGARTWAGADALASQWKYIPVRRLALYIEETLYRGTQWVVFEPNDAPLWAQIRLNIGAFMHGLFRQGAFQGSRPQDAYLVKCDSETTTQADIDAGVVEHHRRLRTAQTGRVRHHQAPAAGWADRSIRRDVAQFSVNPQRFDPYKNFKFRVKWDGRYVAGISKVGALKRSTELVEHREGGDPSTSRKSPAVPSSRPSPWSAASPTTPSSRTGPTRSGASARAGQRSLAQGFPQGSDHRGSQRGRPAGHGLQGVPLLGVRVPGPARPRRQRQRRGHPDLKLENEGWERDTAVTEPQEQ
jgi:hypothetical protein